VGGGGGQREGQALNSERDRLREIERKP
jgi:hypothetical protein